MSMRVLRSTAPREALRLDLAVSRMVLIGLTFAAFWPATRWFVPGPFLLHGLTGLSLFVLVFLAARLGGDSVGDVSSGLLDLMLLAGVRPHDWILLRLVNIWIGFASVWIVRIPALFLIFSLGDIERDFMLMQELMMLVGFAVVSSLALLFSLRAESRARVSSKALLALLAWDFLLMAPGLVTGFLPQFTRWSVPDSVVPWLTTIAGFSLSRVATRLVTLRAWPFSEAWPICVLYGVVTTLLLLRVHRMLQTHVAMSAPGPATGKRLQELPQRASRRCWDDAFSWQAFALHGGGWPLIQTKALIYVVLGILVLAALGRGYGSTAFVLLAIFAGVMLFYAINKPGDCLTREFRDNTISTLLLTPHELDSLLNGWQRGAWRLAGPDLLMWAVIIAASYLVSPVGPAITLTCGMLIVSSGPFLLLSPLVPFSVTGIATGLALITLLIVVVGVCVACGVVYHSLCAPALLVPLGWLYNRILRRVILPYWMRQKLAAVI